MQRGHHRRIDAGILAGMIVPPPDYTFDASAADTPLTREAGGSYGRGRQRGGSENRGATGRGGAPIPGRPRPVLRAAVSAAIPTRERCQNGSDPWSMIRAPQRN